LRHEQGRRRKGRKRKRGGVIVKTQGAVIGIKSRNQWIGVVDVRCKGYRLLLLIAFGFVL